VKYDSEILIWLHIAVTYRETVCGIFQPTVLPIKSMVVRLYSFNINTKHWKHILYDFKFQCGLCMKRQQYCHAQC
jgi:hypothetical protein